VDPHAHKFVVGDSTGSNDGPRPHLGIKVTAASYEETGAGSRKRRDSVRVPKSGGIEDPVLGRVVAIDQEHPPEWVATLGGHARDDPAKGHGRPRPSNATDSAAMR
jgi:hypothetical protein